MLSLILVGFGKMGIAHYRTIEESTKSNLYGIIDPNIDKKIKKNPEIRFFSDINELDFNNFDIDGAVVSSSTDSHYGIVKKLLVNEIPILVEKPLTTNIKELDELLNIRDGNNSIIRVGFIELHNPVLPHIRKIINKNIKKINISRLSTPINNKRGLSDVLYDLAIHDISIIDNLFGLTSHRINTKNLQKTDNQVSSAEVSFTLNDIDVSLTTSNSASLNKREWEVYTDEFLYIFDFLNLKIIKKHTEKEISPEVKSLNFDISSLHKQLDDFILSIEKKDSDYKHLETIKNTHYFIESLY